MAGCQRKLGQRSAPLLGAQFVSKQASSRTLLTRPFGQKHETVRNLRTILRGGFLFSVALLFSPLVETPTPAQSPRQTAGNVRVAETLEPGKPIQRELTVGESHSYQFLLDAHQSVGFLLDPRMIDLVVTASGPDGDTVLAFDSVSVTQRPIVVLVLAEQPGPYRLDVRAMERAAPRGHYKLQMEAPRTATPEDQSRTAAERALEDAERCRAQGTTASLRQAIAKAEESIALWRAAGDRRGEAESLSRLGRLHSLVGEMQTALTEYHEAVLLRQAEGDRRGEAVTLQEPSTLSWGTPRRRPRTTPAP